MAQAKWRMASWLAAFFPQRTRRRRKRLSRECARSTTQRRALAPGRVCLARASSPRVRRCRVSPRGRATTCSQSPRPSRLCRKRRGSSLDALPRLGHVAIEAGARQVAEADLVTRVEEVRPAFAQMDKERVLVLEQTVAPAIERIIMIDTPVDAELIGQRGGVEPVAVRAPLRTGRNQPVKHRHAQDFSQAAPSRLWSRSSAKKVSSQRRRRAGLPASTRPTTAAGARGPGGRAGPARLRFARTSPARRGPRGTAPSGETRPCIRLPHPTRVATPPAGCR